MTAFFGTLLGQPNIWTGPQTINQTAQAGTAETPLTIKVSDDSGSIAFGNANSTDGVFQPLITGATSGNLGASGAALTLRGTISAGFDSGTVACMAWDVRTSTPAAITTRPLYDWRNNNASMLQLLPLNAGANAALTFAAAGTGTPTFTTRTPGTKVILYPQITANAVDYAFGVATAGRVWASIPSTAAALGFDWYAGQTRILALESSGLLDNTGTVRATGITTPATGVGALMDYTGSAARFIGYNSGTSALIPVQVQGSTIALQPQGTTTFTAATTVNTHTVPERLASYTVATLPAASVGAGALAYASDAAGNGPCIAMSNGTLWKRCDNTATTVA